LTAPTGDTDENSSIRTSGGNTTPRKVIRSATLWQCCWAHRFFNPARAAVLPVKPDQDRGKMRRGIDGCKAATIGRSADRPYRYGGECPPKGGKIFTERRHAAAVHCLTRGTCPTMSVRPIWDFTQLPLGKGRVSGSGWFEDVEERGLRTLDANQLDTNRIVHGTDWPESR